MICGLFRLTKLPVATGLDAIPSAKFKTNYAYFQIVMLAFNIWRYLKMIAELSIGDDQCDYKIKIRCHL